MLNKLPDMIQKYRMVKPGDHVICAVSGGADSVALLFAMYLLKDKLNIRLSAAHFNHHLRGVESDSDASFVRVFCENYDIPLYSGEGQIAAGKKGLEAAAREARYAYLRSLPGIVATAHTADDNAETVLLHLVRGTGLRGLGGIAPVNDGVIRPMLMVTRQEVEAFLEEYHLPFVEDSSNREDMFLRNRIRHHVMPQLKQENPRLAENLSSMAFRLRADSQALDAFSVLEDDGDVEALRRLSPAVRSRAMERILRNAGVREPEAEHIRLAEQLVFSEKPSAESSFPGGVTLRRNYNRLEVALQEMAFEPVAIPIPGETEIPSLGLRICAEFTDETEQSPSVFTVNPQGAVILRPRQTGDRVLLSGGTKSLKKLFIDRKIPASQRMRIPVVTDEQGILGVYGIGVDISRKAVDYPAVRFHFKQIDNGEEIGNA